VGTAQFSPDGQSILIGSDDGSVTLWGPDRHPATIKPVDQRTINEATFNADGSYIATADVSGSVAIWDVHGTRIAGMRGHEGSATGVRFSRDGRQLVSSGVDGTVRVWDVATSSPLAVFDSEDGAVSYVDISTDGRAIVTSARGRQVLRELSCEVCDSREDVVDLAQSRAFRKLTTDEEERFSTS
jgi:WD40 repeat protein